MSPVPDSGSAALLPLVPDRRSSILAPPPPAIPFKSLCVLVFCPAPPTFSLIQPPPTFLFPSPPLRFCSVNGRSECFSPGFPISLVSQFFLVGFFFSTRIDRFFPLGQTPEHFFSFFFRFYPKVAGIDHVLHFFCLREVRKDPCPPQMPFFFSPRVFVFQVAFDPLAPISAQ